MSLTAKPYCSTTPNPHLTPSPSPSLSTPSAATPRSAHGLSFAATSTKSLRLRLFSHRIRASQQHPQQFPRQRHRPEYIPHRIDDPNYVRIFDTTLRDGEQSPGATMTSAEKLVVARQLARLGVDIIEAGFPASSPDDLDAVRSIAIEVGNPPPGDALGPVGGGPYAGVHVPVICGLSRCNKRDIDAAWEAVRHARRPRIHTFIATSEIHMQHKLRKTPEQVVAIAKEMVAYARSLGCPDVEFSPEDAGRLDSCRGSQDPGREHECGRPLGLKFNDGTGELYVADAYHGLRVVSTDGKVSRPVSPQWWQGTRPFSFANGVEIDPATGAVYFTETSTRFQRREFLNIVISGDTTGRLLKYDPKSGEVEVVVDGLAFPNGLAMSRDGTHLLLAETTTGRILRYWLRPPAAAEKEKANKAPPPVMEEVARLPWFPDNIRMSPRGGFWVGIHAKRGKLAEWCITYPWLRRLVLALPTRRVQQASWLLNRLGRQVIAVRLSEEDGKVMEMVSVHGDLQKVFRSVSEVEERNGSLWIGSVMSPFLGVYKL